MILRINSALKEEFQGQREVHLEIYEPILPSILRKTADCRKLYKLDSSNFEYGAFIYFEYRRIIFVLYSSRLHSLVARPVFHSQLGD